MAGGVNAPDHMERAWQEFLPCLDVEHTSPLRLNQARWLFLAGAMSLFDAIATAGAEGLVQRLQELQVELTAFSAATLSELQREKTR